MKPMTTPTALALTSALFAGIASAQSTLWEQAPNDGGFGVQSTSESTSGAFWNLGYADNFSFDVASEITGFSFTGYETDFFGAVPSNISGFTIAIYDDGGTAGLASATPLATESFLLTDLTITPSSATAGSPTFSGTFDFAGVFTTPVDLSAGTYYFARRQT